MLGRGLKHWEKIARPWRYVGACARCGGDTIFGQAELDKIQGRSRWRDGKRRVIDVKDPWRPVSYHADCLRRINRQRDKVAARPTPEGPPQNRRIFFKWEDLKGMTLKEQAADFGVTEEQLAEWGMTYEHLYKDDLC